MGAAMIHPLTPKADILPTPGRGNESGEAAKHLPIAAEPDSDPTKTTDTRPDQGAVNRAVAKIRDVLQESDQRLEIEVDPDLHRVIVKIINQDTNEVIRQIPIKEALELEKRLSDQKGLLIEEHA
jgi:flagellar protein FlaG